MQFYLFGFGKFFHEKQKTVLYTSTLLQQIHAKDYLCSLSYANHICRGILHCSRAVKKHSLSFWGSNRPRTFWKSVQSTVKVVLEFLMQRVAIRDPYSVFRQTGTGRKLWKDSLLLVRNERIYLSRQFHSNNKWNILSWPAIVKRFLDTEVVSRLMGSGVPLPCFS